MLNIILGILLILLGILIIIYYEKYVKNKGGLSFKIRIAGIGFIMIGIGLILDELGFF